MDFRICIFAGTVGILIHMTALWEMEAILLDFDARGGKTKSTAYNASVGDIIVLVTE